MAGSLERASRATFEIVHNDGAHHKSGTKITEERKPQELVTSYHGYHI
jgi:hypothetical protein